MTMTLTELMVVLEDELRHKHEQEKARTQANMLNDLPRRRTFCRLDPRRAVPGAYIPGSPQTPESLSENVALLLQYLNQRK